ncbi:hypothetical protein CBL_00073 [Carabus blaptoides fortunei]
MVLQSNIGLRRARMLVHWGCVRAYMLLLGASCLAQHVNVTNLTLDRGTLPSDYHHRVRAILDSVSGRSSGPAQTRTSGNERVAVTALMPMLVDVPRSTALRPMCF